MSGSVVIKTKTAPRPREPFGHSFRFAILTYSGYILHSKCMKKFFRQTGRKILLFILLCNYLGHRALRHYVSAQLRGYVTI